ncbi:hypothetical protein BOTBODRAFT_462494 [Botryobasidium botryosum FD-172 SS1]|uniref:Uncharacterized protein n=1 Tax=Botryobasidium botryosum (strain FD-172 SS1) TaxID=930990 RepID=A0A067M6N0_BOTB1|nr:hypothetical protein BOTBODRAFT_462494 [Botryobasidium botryosum FD-172 SS1]
MGDAVGGSASMAGIVRERLLTMSVRSLNSPVLPLSLRGEGGAMMGTDEDERGTGSGEPVPEVILG